MDKYTENPQAQAEPVEAFPYRPPSSELRKTYAEIFGLEEPLGTRRGKRIFDVCVSIVFLTLSAPILALVYIAYAIEGLLIKENRGPVFFFYNAISQGAVIPKYKIRLIKMSFVDKEAAKNNDWAAYKAEWNNESRTYVGAFVKKYYVDELPQFWSVLKGDMSIVGPRPLAVHHYERDLAQGNITRKLIRGGLLGLGHINKGTAEMGDPEFEYQYVSAYINYSNWALVKLDMWVIYKGALLIFKGGGH